METKTGRFEGIESYEYKMPSKGNYDDEDIDSDDVSVLEHFHLFHLCNTVFCRPLTLRLRPSMDHSLPTDLPSSPKQPRRKYVRFSRWLLENVLNR